MIDVKRFSGVMNRDDLPENILAPQHIDALNLRFYGGQNGLTAENVKGNYVIPNASLPTTGNNICIGSYFDQVNQLIYFFNYNSQGNHGIYQLDVNSETITKIFLCNTDSISDVLNFDASYPVHSVALVYRDPGQGNLLYWTDGINPPRYINVDTVSSLAPFTSDMLTAAKNAPLTPPAYVYGDDPNVTTNNLRKKLFRFSYRWVYKNGEKSTFSPISKVVLPTGGYNPNTSNDPTKNNYVQIEVFSGNVDCEAIELVGQVNINNTWSDFFTIDSLNLDQYNIPANSYYFYKFYNNGAYVTVPILESDLPFSYLPDLANTLELLNGNTIIYGGITEGYDAIAREDVDVTVTTGLSNPNTPSISFSYTGPNSFTVIIGPTITTGAAYTIYFDYNTGNPGDVSPKNVTYTTLSGDNIDDVVAGLTTLIQGQNIVVDNFGTSGVFNVHTSGFVGTITNLVTSVSIPGASVPQASWKWNCPERLGLVYFDEHGKTNGVVSFASDSDVDITDFAVTTPAFNVLSTVPQIPFVAATINHTPPDWAVAYQWVRADLKPTSFLYWVTNDFADPGDGFLYFCIENLTRQQTQNTGFVPGYDFNEGDRVRVIANYTGGNFVPFVTGGGASLQLDFEILGTVTRTMTTAPNTGNGRFLKVTKPSTLPSATYTATMLVEMYTPKATNAENNEFFYEFGEKYDIYTDAGVRYHRGQITDQNSTNPATFQWYEGDVYYRERGWLASSVATAFTTEYFMDVNYNDYFPSAVNSNGRAWTINPDAQTIYNQAMVRWGGQYEQGTDINNLNIFNPADFDEVDRARGAIRRMMVEDRTLYVYQERGVGVYGIYAKYLQDNAGQAVVTTTNAIITVNNVRYLVGTYGLGEDPTSLVRGKNAHYFVDPVRGYQVRRSADGLTPISELYKGQFYIRDLIIPYNKNYESSSFVKSKILGTYNFFDEEYVCSLQGGNLYTADKLRTVDNGIITNGDINTPSTLYAPFTKNLGPFKYVASFAGTPLAGDIVHFILRDSIGNVSIDYPILVLAGWTPTDVVNAAVSAINGSFFWVATATTYFGNPAVEITNSQAGAIIYALVNIEYPALVTTFEGTPQAGDVVTVSVSADPVSPPLPYTQFTYTFGAGNTIANMISSIVASVNAGGNFTATSVTYNGKPGFTIRKITSIYIYGSTTLTIAPSSTISPYTFSFNELRNGYTSFFSYHPEWLDNAQELIYSWKEGRVYKHNNTTNYSNFYGTQYPAFVTVVFNQNYHTKKSWNSLMEVANTIWSVPTMYTNTYSYGTTKQVSNLVEAEFQLLEGNPSSAIKRDANSSGGKINGNFMKGNYLVVKFQKTNANNLVNLSEVSARFTDSPLTVK
jgi:hypothetical protein